MAQGKRKKFPSAPGAQNVDLTRPNEAPRGKTPPTPVDAPNRPLASPSGAINVDSARFPHLYQALDRGLVAHRARRARWAEVIELRTSGRIDDADRLAAELMGVNRADRPEMSAPPRPSGPLPPEVVELVAKLKKTTDKSAASKIRAELRRLGHRGGIRGL